MVAHLQVSMAECNNAMCWNARRTSGCGGLCRCSRRIGGYGRLWHVQLWAVSLYLLSTILLHLKCVNMRFQHTIFNQTARANWKRCQLRLGVCGGDGTGCVLDCYGAPNGRAQVDQCGV